jgi:hypothetical protein
MRTVLIACLIACALVGCAGLSSRGDDGREVSAVVPPPPPPPAERAAADMRVPRSRSPVVRDATRPLASTGRPARAGSTTAPDAELATPAAATRTHDPASAAPGTAGVAAAADTGTAVVDRLLAQLQPGHVAFNAPQAINVEDTVLVQLVVRPGASRAELRERIEGPGRVLDEAVQVANTMQARLTGEGFRITAQTPERQLVSSGVTEWAWEITPTAPGRHTLTLALDALVPLDGSVVPRTLRTFRKPIEVDVTAGQRVASFVEENGKWVWTTLLVPVFGWVAKRRKDRKAAAKDDAGR